jgi:hypothetical protein
MGKLKNGLWRYKDIIQIRIELNIFNIFSFTIFAYYAYILLRSNYFLYSNDGNETFGTLLHADNLIKYGHLNNYLTDESTGVEKQQHPISHVSQGNWPRISVALLKIMGLNEIFIIGLVTLGMVAAFLITYSKLMIPKTSKIFALIFLFLFMFDFLHVTQWFLNLYRTWQVALYFFVLFIISKIESDKRNRVICYTILTIFLAISTYGELINAIWLFISISLLLLFRFFSFSNLEKIYLFLVMIVGSCIGFGIHVIQTVLTISFKDSLFYFMNINRVRKNGQNSFEMNEIADKYNLVFWENYGISTDNLKSVARLYLETLNDLFASSLLVNFMIPVVLILMISYGLNNKFFALILIGVVNTYFLLSGESYLLYLFIVIILIVFYSRKFLPSRNLFIVKIASVGLFVVSTFTIFSPPLNTWGTSYIYGIWISVVSVAVICSYTLIKKVNRNSKSNDFNMNYFISIILLSLFNYSIQRKLSWRLYYPELINLNGAKLFLLIIVYISYNLFIIRWLWNLSKLNLKETSKVFSFVLAPLIGLVIVGFLSPGYILTGYFLREDFLWKGLGSSILGVILYLSIKSYFDNFPPKNLWGYTTSFIWMPILYLLIQFNIIQIQPYNSFFEVGEYLQKIHANKVLVSNNYPPSISHFTKNYTELTSLNNLESFALTSTPLSELDRHQFSDRVKGKSSKVENYIFMDINVRFKTTYARYLESNGKPMPASSYCQLFLDRNFNSESINLTLSPGAFGNIGPYGYWCDFKVTQKI